VIELLAVQTTPGGYKPEWKCHQTWALVMLFTYEYETDQQEAYNYGYTGWKKK
jgi:hypothetical protein